MKAMSLSKIVSFKRTLVCRNEEIFIFRQFELTFERVTQSIIVILQEKPILQVNLIIIPWVIPCCNGNYSTHKPQTTVFLWIDTQCMDSKYQSVASRWLPTMHDSM